MMIRGGVAIDVIPGSPGSPPGMTDSKSSKSSSFRSSINGDDDAVLADVSHFEDIGLDDDAAFAPQFLQATTKSPPNPYSPTFSSDLRSSSLSSASTPRLQYSRDLAHKPRPRTARPALPSLQTHVRTLNGRAATAPAHGLGLSLPQRSPTHLYAPHSALSSNRRRSPSPNTSLRPRDPNVPIRPRRSSWQSNHSRKSSLELELECDEDNGDDIPDGLILDNVPLSPRPVQERAAKSVPNSKNTSPERAAKDYRVRSVGNGTPPVAAAQGSLRSPTWKSETSIPTLSTTSSAAPSPIKTRAKSWANALHELTPEAQDLTEKLEEHADTVEQMKAQRSSTGSMPVRRPKSADAETKPRVKSALAELPPLRRTNIMIDPVPISKEKEAVLSRTRPSWLPPKDPAEEKKHLREYQKMMAQSAEAERQREVAKRTKSECRDTAADSIMHLWEDDILPRWNDAIRERRTRDLWWRGIAPRSRGRVWRKAIGNELGLTETSYQAALRRANEAENPVRSSHASDDDTRNVALFDVIRRDVEDRTWRDLRIFQAGGPLHQALLDVLKAYAMYRSDIGYVRGLNTIAALLLLNLPTPTSAFIALANILNRSLPLSFLANDPGAKASAYNLVLQTLSHKSQSLHDHLISLPGHNPDVYLNSPFISLFTSQLSLDEAARLWDVFVFEGDAVIVRAGVAFLMRKEVALLGCNNMEEVAAVIDGTAAKAKSPRVIGTDADEEKWMALVREAGKN